jgi:hypothetical protein
MVVKISPFPALAAIIQNKHTVNSSLNIYKIRDSGVKIKFVKSLVCR